MSVAVVVGVSAVVEYSMIQYVIVSRMLVAAGWQGLQTITGTSETGCICKPLDQLILCHQSHQRYSDVTIATMNLTRDAVGGGRPVEKIPQLPTPGHTLENNLPLSGHSAWNRLLLHYNIFVRIRSSEQRLQIQFGSDILLRLGQPLICLTSSISVVVA